MGFAQFNAWGNIEYKQENVKQYKVFDFIYLRMRQMNVIFT